MEDVTALVHSFSKKGGNSLFQVKGINRRSSSSSPSASQPQDFLYWVKSGFAFALPLLGFALLALLAIFLF